MNIKTGIAVSAFCLLTSCEDLAIHFTPTKKPIASHSKLAEKAEHFFWDTLHQGKYDNISTSTKLLLAAYLENPNDPLLAAHLGFLHIWKITERQRIANPPPEIVDDIILAKKYFADAVELQTNDARFLGFYGDSEMVEGSIFHDKRQQTKAYFTLKNAIHQWPQFNYFTAGYVMTTLPKQSEHFQTALDWQWSTLDLCAQTKINHNNPDFSPYLNLETQVGPQRACWNSWIAPYNFEGFFLNMGDMLVKQGDWKTAITLYKNATLMKNYSTWPYRKLLENRIAHAKENVENFQHSSASPDKSMMINSGYGCVACHQNK